jgi:uncharacterized protein
MERVAHFIVRHRVAVLLVFVACCIASALAAPYVRVNKDMTVYLPESLQTKQGLAIMNDEFGQIGTIRVMFDGIDDATEKELASQYRAIDSVSGVVTQHDDSGQHTLFTLTCQGGMYSDAALEAYNGAVETSDAMTQQTGAAHHMQSSVGSSSAYLIPILVFAFFLGVAILFIMSKTWVEPFLILATILLAVVLNLGTNIVFPSISDITYTVSAILQMALSMDYSIMLMSRYRLERAGTDDCRQAMEAAIAKGFRAVASSSVTTVVGLLTLVLMSFTIGRDLGLVLAKGVALSLLAELCVMPALAIWADGLIQKTPKPAPAPALSGLARVGYAHRREALVAFVIVVVAAFLVRDNMQAAYHVDSSNEDSAAVQEVFPSGETIAILYQMDDAQAAGQAAQAIQDLPGVTQLMSAATTLDASYTAEELIQAAGSLNLSSLTLTADDGTEEQASASDLGVDENMVYMLYYLYCTGADPDEVPALRLLVLSKDAKSQVDPTWTATLDELLDYLQNKVMTSQALSSYITDEQREQVQRLSERLQQARGMLEGQNWGRIVLTSSYGQESDEMRALLSQIDDAMSAVGGTYYLVGEAPMAREMVSSFLAEFSLISWVTMAALYIIVAVTFRSLLVPLPLVLIIQSAYGLVTGINGLAGNAIYYMALIVVQGILMGATIDYAILFTSNYREARTSLQGKEALARAYANSSPTILTSGSILTIVCLALGIFGGGAVSQICLVLAEGAAMAVLLVIFLLPGALAALDRFVVKRPAAE